MAKNTGSASTGRSTSKTTAKSTSARSSKSAASTSVSSKSAASKSTPSRSAASKAPVKVRRSQIRQARLRTPQARNIDITHVDRDGIEISQVSVPESAIATVRGAAPQLMVDTFGPVDRSKIHLLDELVGDAEEITIIGKDNRRVPVAGALLKALATVMGALDRGATVTLTEADMLDTELTSQEAADLLNVSRPYVVKLAREGVLHHHRVGNRHRFTLTDVLEHRTRMRAATEESLGELAPTGGYTAADF